MTSSQIKREAFGRMARIGDFYDARRDNFITGLNLFEGKLEDDDIVQIDNPSTASKMIMSDTLAEKYKNLNITAELKLSILAGLIEIRGAGEYLKDEKASARTKSVSLFYNVATVTNEINVHYLRKKIDQTLLEDQEATHIVVKIDWGASCTVTCEETAATDEDITKVHGEFDLALKKIGNGLLDLTGSASVDYKDFLKNLSNNFKFEIKCDVSLNKETIPTTFEGVMEVARKLPSLVDETNGGKGIPIRYELLSLDKIREVCKLPVLNQIVSKIDEVTIERILQLLGELCKVKQLINDRLSNLISNSDIVNPVSLREIQMLQSEFSLFEAKIRPAISELTVQVRSGQKEVSDLNKIIIEFSDGQFSLDKVHSKLLELQPVFKKIQLFTYLKERGVICVGKDYNFYAANIDKAYVLYIDPICSENTDTQLQDNRNMLIRLMNTKNINEVFKFFVVDIQSRPDLKPTNFCISSVIHRIVEGNVIEEDVLRAEMENLGQCLVKFKLGNKFQQNRVKPNRRVLVQMSCPQSGHSGNCSVETKKWLCNKCKDQLEFGMDDHLFYCSCGNSLYSNALFRCNEIPHGVDFSEYDKELLLEKLKAITLREEINLLVLGETGVGKSTWINALVNYTTFSSLDEAVKTPGRILATIPSHFTITDQDGSMKDIYIGEKDPNEDDVSGQSSTQEPKCYIIDLGGKETLSIIDTPGIGDVRGLEQDKINMDNILAHLRNYDKIHGICILLKPNEARATTSFKFCLTEILKSLEKSAVDSIAFCFTNSRGTFYRPGESRVTISQLLKKIRETSHTDLDITPHNTFCMDNEAFRFLACIKKGIKFSETEIGAFQTSWTKAVESTQQLLKYVRGRPAHDVSKTISLNEARAIILRLCKPLADISTHMNKTIASIEKRQDMIKAHNITIEDLKSKLHFTGSTFEVIDIDRPRTVCTSDKCKTFRYDDEKKESKTVYSQVCHDNCTLRGISVGTVGEAGLQSCYILKPWDGRMTCHICGCDYKLHMHLMYELKAVSKQFSHPEIEKLQTSEMGKMELVAAGLKEFETLKEELKEEEAQVCKTNAIFAAFLKNNALVPYNDCVADHLAYCIKLEQESFTQDTQKIEKMQNSLELYFKERDIIEEAINNKDSTFKLPEAHEIEKMRKELLSMKHYGKELKEAYDGVKNSMSRIASYYHKTVVNVPQTKGGVMGKWIASHYYPTRVPLKEEPNTKGDKKYSWQFWK